MNLLTSTHIVSRRPSVAVLVFTLGSALLLGAGCSDGACFRWTEEEGACPAQEDAMAFFEDPTCHFSDIRSVESDGEFEDDACCYAVIKWDDTDERIFDCGPTMTVTAVGVGGFGGGGSGVGGAPGTGGGVLVSSSVGQGEGGAMPVCIRCPDALMMDGDPKALCPESVAIYDEVQACACNGPCAGVCAESCSTMESPSQECIECLGDSMKGCGEPFAACTNDVP